MTGLRVELVSEHASPLVTVGPADAGGQNVHVAALATQLAALGCTVTVVTRADAPSLPRRVEMAPRVQVEHLTAGPRRPVPKDELWDHMPGFARQLRHRWQAARPDIVHAHFWMSGWASESARRGMADPPPLVQTFHALGAVKRRHQGRADTSPAERCGIEAELTRSVDHVVATCTDEVKELTALGGDPRRLTVVPCGVDPLAFRPSGPAAPARRGGYRMVVVSRLVPRKGIDDVVAALPSLPGTELLVAGGPPADTLAQDREARRLVAIARRLGVDDRVQLLGAVARSDVPALLRSADLVACVPWYEPFGIVALEAMACGIPVVGSAVGGLLDTVQHGRTGLLVPPRDPRAIAAAAARLLGNPSLGAHMGAEGAARVRQEYTWPQVARATLDVYAGMVAEDHQAGPSTGRGWAVPA
jgi:glycosyltransferase involved in cell wall biosynthesis